MKKIGILSDTHAWWDDKYLKYFDSCDEIWHVGDIGNEEIANKLASFRPLRAVYGNIDGCEIRSRFPEIQYFNLENVSVLMKHIGGYPGHYDLSVFSEIQKKKPQLFISGHSHILKVMYDKKLEMLHINPGAAGKQGFHKVRTLIRVTLDAGNIKDLEVIELS